MHGSASNEESWHFHLKVALSLESFVPTFWSWQAILDMLTLSLIANSKSFLVLTFYRCHMLFVRYAVAHSREFEKNDFALRQTLL